MKATSIMAESFTQSLQQALGDRLRSVVLYGSAARQGGPAPGNLNLLVTTSRLGPEELDAIADVLKPWLKAGNPPPLLFTEARMRQSSDVFPLEWLEMQDRHCVLHGEDPVSGLEVSTANLRLQLESEWKGRLIQLREGYLRTLGNKREVGMMLAAVQPGLQTLLRGWLRLANEAVPDDAAEVAERAAATMNFDARVFADLSRLKEGGGRHPGVDPVDCFRRLLSAVEKIVDHVDAWQS